MKTMPLLVLAFFVSFTIHVTGECPGVPSMVPVVACRRACGTELMFELCMATLREEFRDPYGSNEVTAYARVAARRAFMSYIPTMDVANVQCANSSLSDEEKAAYIFCLVESYHGAQIAMGRVKRWLGEGCWFGGLNDEYMAALLGLEGCRDRIMKLLPPPPMYTMVMDDRNKSFLAFILGKLLGI